MKELNLKLIKEELREFSVDNNSYINTYSEFIKYFRQIETIEKHHLIISSHFVYGWMPTILSLNQENLPKVLELLNQAKKGYLLTAPELDILKNSINNSLVGLSKLLHFIRPEVYAIWDSRIFKFLTGKKSTYGIGKPTAYLNYIQDLKRITNQKEFDQLFQIIQESFDYRISKLRAIEIVMFQSKTDFGKSLINQ
ncbi:hypothetical protein [Gillisia limnaea]|uniref:Uncharacterized protein n=1 Tax=Gillisia limnaea (strain DSM 15749 / LMG 21470 / R-8282) TaxID=865937 RepID=H2BXH7_GILLR|nr:hypothetical protein [Gillisia limnaea]EHQ02059.1 hypothetical protein Gilli_1400 [Gillisia limnaea DSM 15749]